MRRLILRNFQSPGDILMLTAAVRDLHRTYPYQFLTDVRTPCPDLWEGNPFVTPLSENSPDVRTVDCHYPLIHESNQSPYHFIHGFRLYLNETLKLEIKAGPFKGDVHLREQEKDWLSQVDEITGGEGSRFWLIVSGGKTDFTNKWWDPDRSQAVVDHFRGRVQFVQVGQTSAGHVHPPLENVIDLRGRTDLRQLVRLTYHADGAVCPVTMLMHLAAAVPTPTGPAAEPSLCRDGRRSGAGAVGSLPAPPVPAHQRLPPLL